MAGSLTHRGRCHGCALLSALARCSLSQQVFWSLLLETGRITVSVLFLIVATTFFSRMLACLPMALAEFLIDGSKTVTGLDANHPGRVSSPHKAIDE